MRGATLANIRELGPNTIEDAFKQALNKGVTARHGHGFLLIPYYRELETERLLPLMIPERERGFPTCQSLLLRANFTVAGGQRIAHLHRDRKKDYDNVSLALASGLPYTFDPSTLHRFLDHATIGRCTHFQEEMGRLLVGQAKITGKIINQDSTTLRSYTRRLMHRAHHGKTKQNVKGVRVFAAQDQETRQPIFVRPFYTGTKVVNAVPIVTESVQRIIGADPEQMHVFDREHFIGVLFAHFESIAKSKFLTVVRMSKSRKAEMEQIPIEDFIPLEKRSSIASTQTTMKHYPGQLRLVVLRLEEEDECKYIGFATNDENLPSIAFPGRYRGRQRIEHWFEEDGYFEWEKLPGLRLNKMMADQSVKLFARNAVDAFRKDLGPAYSSREIGSICQEFLDVMVDVRRKRNKIEVCVHGVKDGNLIQEALQKAQDRLKAKGLGPEVPWLYGYAVEYRFT